MPREFPADRIDYTEISADYTQTSSDGTTSLDGNVIIEQHQIRVTADHADYNTSSEVLNFRGNVHIDTMSLSLDADGGTISLDASENDDDCCHILYRRNIFVLVDRASQSILV